MSNVTNKSHQRANYLKSAAVATIAVLGLGAGAQAQMPTLASSYNGTMTANGPNGRAVNMKVFHQGANQRIEIPTEQGTMVSLLNSRDMTAYSFSKDPAGAMGTQAMRIDYGTAASRLGTNFDQGTGPTPVKIGSAAVAGQYCTLYQIESATACITGDGIMMRVISNDGGKMEMTSLTRGAQAQSLFSVPAGYSIVDISNGIPTGMSMSASGSVDPGSASQTDNQVQGLLADQAGKQTKKQIEKAARKQIGGSLGGAIGGGLVGGTLGNEAGKAVTGMMGGLFGKKKKKKKTASEKKKDDDKK